MKKAFLLAFMVLGTGSMQGTESQPTKPKPRPAHVETARRHHLYVLGIAICVVVTGCGYQFLLPRLCPAKTKENQEA